MDLKKKRNTAWVCLVIFFLGFLFFWEQRQAVINQSAIEQNAGVIAPALWNYDAKGPVEYLKVACQLHNFEEIRVYTVADKLFLDIEGPKPGLVARIFENIGLIFKIKLDADIELNGSKIGRISAIQRHDTIYQYLYLLLTLGLLALVVQYFYRTTLANQTLEIRVKERTRELAVSEERFYLALEGADLGMWDWDINSGKAYFGPRYLSMLGYEQDNLSHTFSSWESLLHPDDKTRVLEYIREWLTRKKAHLNVEFRMLHSNGSYRWINSRGRVVEYDEDDSPVRAAGTHLDIHNQKEAELEKIRLETELVQVHKMEAIGTLAGGIAHDFNNMLFPIIGYSEMLLEDFAQDSQIQSSVKEIYSAAVRAKDLVQQILTFSRQQQDELKLMKIQPVLIETLKMVRATLPATIDIHQEVEDSCGPVKANSTQIHQIIMNLSTNAFHAMEDEGGTLTIQLKAVFLDQSDSRSPELPPGHYACLTVQDTGIGIPENVRKKIFEPFFTTKEQGKGTGMGLSVVHGIVKKISGFLDLQSIPGQGTVIHLYLPVQKDIPIEDNDFEQDTILGGTERILLVDDEEQIVSMEKLMLERLGYQVVAKADSLEALETFRSRPDSFDLVITDLAMPGMAGDKFARQLLKIDPGVNIILCTGFSEKFDPRASAEIGIKEMLLKPIVMKELAQKIRDVLKQ